LNLAQYEPPEYDLFNLNNDSGMVGTTPVPLVYEGQTNAAVIVPPDLTLRVKQVIIQNTTTSLITVQLQATTTQTGLPSPVNKTPPIPVPANSAVTLDDEEWSISVRTGYSLAAVSSAANSANVFVKAYFVKGTGSPI
jgi:hypothetical protein